MRLTGKGIWGPPSDHDNAIAVLRRAVELGIDFIDTADSYGPDVAEELSAEALRVDGAYPPGLVMATKGGLERTGPNQWPRNGRPEHLKAACEGSLERLGLDRIDLYQLHAPDPSVPYAESVGAMKELQDEGKVKHVGVSNVSLDQLHEAQSIVEVVSVQNRYNLTDRHGEDVLDFCEANSLGFIPWFPLAAGQLAEPGGPLADAARRHDATPGQIALAWLLYRSTCILPIPGTASLQHLEENVAAGAIRLTPEEFEEIDKASRALAGSE
jgi:pyridoxine 4-dehydrogenase